MTRRRFLTQVGTAAIAGFIPLSSAQGGGRAATGYIRTNWSRDPYTYGSYSFIPKGAGRRQTRDLGAPVGNRLFFAGEAAHPEYNSTVHAALESGQLAADAVDETEAASVAVVGAGVSGLSAASQLEREGYRVTVFEARNRIGGRIRTDNRLGVPLDLGASWLHGTRGNPLTAITEQLGIPTRVTKDSYILRGKGGRRMRNSQAPDWLDEVTEVQHGAGAGLAKLNIRAYLNDEDYGGDELVFPEGYSQILRSFQPDLNVRLNTDIRQIKITGSAAELRDSRGRGHHFDAVIVTVPLGILKRGHITFAPPLPAKKQKAIAQLGMGLLDKVYLRYDSVFWDRDVTWIITPENGLPPGYFNQWFNLFPYIGHPIIVAFNGAGPARELAARSDTDIVRMAQQTLATAYR
ncbi:FAD-dependent oxidoreductase [Tropicibacter sp. Alg240-R139]|uniref:flavin monoamine oxidase family protein n=1 Tax=Tropicibacter sp. Alg240-R139 TaxID=2305991 RepID=UPI0013DEC1B4|nr:FAD-dependent oxidoreductase [Tropicibacter sp. Alg240-R139]